MRFSSKTFKKSLRNKKRSTKKRKTRKQKQNKKTQRGGSAGSALYRNIPKEATFSDAPTDGLE